MKTIKELGLSLTPWVKYGDIVEDAEGNVIFNAYDDSDYPNARLIAAAPKLYEKAYSVLDNLLVHLQCPEETIRMNRAEVATMAKELLDALAEASGEVSNG